MILPSGKQPHNRGKIHPFFYSWVNQLFLWPFSVAFCMFTRGYQRVYHTSISYHMCIYIYIYILIISSYIIYHIPIIYLPKGISVYQCISYQHPHLSPPCHHPQPLNATRSAQSAGHSPRDWPEYKKTWKIVMVSMATRWS